jgi:hypothetical protein
MKALPLRAHVGSEPPAHWDEIEARQQQHGDDAAPHLRDAHRPPLAAPGFAWERFGFEPRWVGDDTVDCVVALQPSIFHNQGADEFARFRQGAVSRKEIALVVSAVGTNRDGGVDRRPLFSHDNSVQLGNLACSISSRPLGAGAQIALNDGLGDADRDLGLRLLGHQPELNWSAIELQGLQTESVYGSQTHPPVGSIEPILVTPLGETVVGAWISPDDVERRYVVPTGAPWELILDWLGQRAIPEYVPGAMRRARAPISWSVEFMTQPERRATEALNELEASYRRQKAELQATLAQAKQDADQIRDGLLYGTGKDLIDAVAAVLGEAGIQTVDLDEMLGGTRNADLLCSYGSGRRLVEVRSASGSPSERAYHDLLRHLREWPNLAETTPVDGGVLILNHEHRKDPLDRSSEPYTRQDFLASQTEPIITTWQLFQAWRDKRWAQIRSALFTPFDGEIVNDLESREIQPSSKTPTPTQLVGSRSKTRRIRIPWRRGR